MIVVLDLTENEIEKLRDLSDTDDVGPWHEGWQSRVMVSLGEKIRIELGRLDKQSGLSTNATSGKDEDASNLKTGGGEGPD